MLGAITVIKLVRIPKVPRMQTEKMKKKTFSFKIY